MASLTATVESLRKDMVEMPPRKGRRTGAKPGPAMGIKMKALLTVLAAELRNDRMSDLDVALRVDALVATDPAIYRTIGQPTFRHQKFGSYKDAYMNSAARKAVHEWIARGRRLLRS